MPVDYLIRFCNNTADLIQDKDQIKDGKKEVFFDPITAAIISSIIQFAIQNYIIPYIQRKCKERKEQIKSGCKKPSLFYRFMMNRAVKKTLKSKGFKQAKAICDEKNITVNDISLAIFANTANMPIEEYNFIMKNE